MLSLPIVTELDWSSVRERLASAGGPTYWKSLEELADTAEFRAMVGREFPAAASEWDNALSRRRFLTLMGASIGLAGLAGCGRQPLEHIYPYVRAPEGLIPGKPLFFATALSLGGVGTGVLVESHMGRPTKIEGNPDHPGSLGSTDTFTQASILSLYDPDRSQVVARAGEIDTWETFVGSIRSEIDALRSRQGRGLHILTETITSPSLAAQLTAVLAALPEAVWHQYQPINRDNERAGLRLAFGADVQPVYQFDRAEVIVSLDGDFLECGAGSVRYQRDFASRRRVRQDRQQMSRFYAVESTPTTTGASADHRLPLRAGEIVQFARTLAARLGLAPAGFALPAASRSSQATSASTSFDPGSVALHAAWLDAVVDDLRAHRGAAIVVAGAHQPPEVHALAHLINASLAAPDATVRYIEPLEASATDQLASLRDLATALEADEVDVLLVLGANPAYASPADLKLADRLKRARQSVHYSYYNDETSALCSWHVPATHELESWGDVRGFDGTITIQQPLIAPLFAGRTAHELLSALFDDAPRSTYDIVRDYWRNARDEDDFERFWQTTVHNGVMADSALAARSVTPVAAAQLPDTLWRTEPSGAGADTLELIIRADTTVWDGRFANNGWLQELPKPLWKLTWDNAALVSPATAERLKLSNEQLVELGRGDQVVAAPVWIVPGHADESITVLLGYGRTRAGHVGNHAGYNAYLLQQSDAPSISSGLTLKKTSETRRLAVTHTHFSMEGRDLVRSGTLAEYREDPHSPAHHGHEEHEHASLYPPFANPGYAWGMAIDVNTCTGCSACVVACQAENNSPVVGKEQVLQYREMHWLRIDRYYSGDLDNPDVMHQPMLCQHCEQAPCEVVCPVAATTHSKEGINEMTYNRCVGTRYCSNNCPYKVRRFNFFNFHPDVTPLTDMIYNPDVTVRSRGVMEKCTFCIQRINEARIDTEVRSMNTGQQHKIVDGDVVTACQAACPSQAIIFGNINDPNSRVSKEKAEPTNYGVLTELNTHPRVTYLAQVRNPNSALAAAEEAHRSGRVVPQNQYLP
ncbi:MAG TPA: TAT-variant-translocated molybdopterin oxidoreductase [Pirellulales bacterium]|nr:TAT-variant-translocated molybdopterin oxidoreductase [Pirellulales bacterium]